ncbi:MAG: HAMP domain-containing protein [Calothrix sp. FI2-JRJ7]|nr:HAMP domain-containing protein [Calothrix sp. FI2-JRJ7]
MPVATRLFDIAYVSLRIGKIVSVIGLLRSISQCILKSHLFAPLYTSFLVLVLLILGQQGLNIWIEHLNYQASNWVPHTLVVQREGEHLFDAVIDEQRAILEDYSQKQFALENYTESSFAFRDSLNKVYNLVKSNPTQLEGLYRIEYLHDYWQSKLNQKANSFDVGSTSHQESPLLSCLRSEINVLIDREKILLRERRNSLSQLNRIDTVINIFSTVTILVVGFNLTRLHRRVEVPLHQLTKIGELWRKGQMSVQLDYSSRDEIGQLAKVLNAMSDETRHRTESIEVRNQQLEDMICALSHDLRTPLLATRTTLNSMIKGAFGPVNDTWREIFEEYRQANEDILKLVSVLLDVGRYEQGSSAHLSFDPLNWKKIFVKAIAQVKASSKCELAFTYKISQSLPTVYGDELEIQRVVQNLLDNAVRASQPNKEISLETTIFGEKQVRVCVRDNGSGIAPADLELLFHRFIQGRGRRGRAGLGLYLCRQIISAHSGTIGVESSLGEGSTFWFTLPVNTDNARFHHANEM